MTGDPMPGHSMKPAVPWLPGEEAPNRVPPRECCKAAQEALMRAYGVYEGRLAYPFLREAVDWLRRALEQMAAATEVEQRVALGRIADAGEFGVHDGELMRNIAREALGLPMPEDED